jgi:hypothetical protein
MSQVPFSGLGSSHRARRGGCSNDHDANLAKSTLTLGSKPDRADTGAAPAPRRTHLNLDGVAQVVGRIARELREPAKGRVTGT